ncbi:hypothetical protein [Cognatishimia sp.]|uniref:hypothetical protein n=1 Tax=Cognatishimia sp. TaxID=2211648 RepID=UPI003514B5AD|nr:hypothetical protein [Legionellales bacterium]NQY58422.1 hypothetical protein [Cognatishimia sp.]
MNKLKLQNYLAQFSEKCITAFNIPKYEKKVERKYYTTYYFDNYLALDINMSYHIAYTTHDNNVFTFAVHKNYLNKDYKYAKIALKNHLRRKFKLKNNYHYFLSDDNFSQA